MAKNKPTKNQPTVDDLKAPLLAAVGAADLALERVNEIVATLRERAGEARTDAETRVEESRARLTKLQEDLPTQFGDLRERLTTDELRKVAESYAEAAQTTLQQARRAWRGRAGAAAQPARARGGPRARRALHRPGRRADPGGAGQRGVADPRGRRACRQAGRRRAAEEGCRRPPRPRRPRPRRRPPRRLRPRRLRPRRSPRSSNSTRVARMRLRVDRDVTRLGWRVWSSKA